MNDSSINFENKIDITVLITSINQREITIETANYYSEMCNEVIIVDEEQPYLSDTEVNKLKIKGITYIPFKGVSYKKSLISLYEKRLAAARHSRKQYVVHSNHDERYAYNDLLACLAELEKDKNLIFCAGQAVAVRQYASKVYFTRSYKKLNGYQNFKNKVEERLYHHAKVYSPIAHHAVWKKEFYINTTERTISTHEFTPDIITALDEVIFELIADLAGNSKTINDLYWIRNRINSNYPREQQLENGETSLKIIKDKLDFVLKDLDNVQLDIIINNLVNSFPSFKSKTFLKKNIISVKLILLNLIKRKRSIKRIDGVDDIYTLLNNNKIKYEKNDVNNLLNSLSL